MSAKFEVRYSETGLLGDTRIYAEFHSDGFQTFTAQGAAEVVTTAAFVKTIQHWASVAIFTYYFNSSPVTLAHDELHTRVLGVCVQRHRDSAVTSYCPEGAEPLTVVLAGDHIVVAAGSDLSYRELLRVARSDVAVLHLELPRPSVEGPAACIPVALAQQGNKPVRLACVE